MASNCVSVVEGGDEAGDGAVGEQSTDGPASSAAARRIPHGLPGHFVSLAQPRQLRTAAAAAGVALGRARYVTRPRR